MDISDRHLFIKAGVLLKEGSKVRELYNSAEISERHRHRYEVNSHYVKLLAERGLLFSGKHIRADEQELMEFLELPEHKFFVATQSHPEFRSRFGTPSPLFIEFVKACAS